MKKYAIRVPFPYGDFLYITSNEKIVLFDTFKEADEYTKNCWKVFEIVEYMVENDE
jgi:Na+-transporting NADH:ubiquinone oxidoreductase subunit NqrF